MYLFERLFQFLSSLKLAVSLLVVFSIVLAIGTYWESHYGAPAARQAVYGTLWFLFLLLILWINVLCAALSRWPWKRHHIGFLTTHLGILTLLGGSFITQQWGVEGILALQEGASDNRIELESPMLIIEPVDAKEYYKWKKARFSEKITPDNPWSRSIPSNELEATIDYFYENASPSLQVTAEGPADYPGLQVKLKNLRGHSPEISEWLFLKENKIRQNQLELGPLKIYFIEESKFQALDESTESKPQNDLGSLILTLKNGSRVDLKLSNSDLSKPIAVPNTAYQVQILRYLPDAAVTPENQLINRSENSKNPAIELEIRGPEGVEKYTLFSEASDLDGIHGKETRRITLSCQWLFTPPRDLASIAGEIYFALAANGDLLYRLRHHSNLNQPQENQTNGGQGCRYCFQTHNSLGEIRKVQVGAPISTHWMGIEFVIQQLIPNAKPEVIYKKVPLKPKQTGTPAIHLRLEDNHQNKDAHWLSFASSNFFNLGGKFYKVSYGNEAYPLGFSVELKKFSIKTDVSSLSKSDYQSQVTLREPDTEKSFDALIFMNNPLHYKGLTIYQSSYSEDPSGITSIFSVAYDPGTFVKYLGSAIMVLGIILMFFFKPLFIQKRLKNTQLQSSTS